MKKVFIVVFLFTIVCILLQFNEKRWNSNKVLCYDVSGYYLYLPAVFLYNDLAKLSFYPGIDQKYRIADGREWYGIYDQENTGKRVDKYPAGMAIAKLPFFLAAHMAAKLRPYHAADGYSKPYQFFISMSSIFWSAIGLYFTGKVLRTFYPVRVVVVTLLLLGFGTNIFVYSWLDTGLSHPLLFMQFALFLWCFIKWQQQYATRYLALQGLLLGWILITRPVDIMIAIIPMLYMIIDLWQKKDITGFLRRNGRGLLLAAVCFAAVTGVQLCYWKYVTGHFIHFSYEEEGFDFRNPHILKGLLSYYKGWFLYTPLAVVAIAGLFFLPPSLKRMRIPILVYLVIIIYIVFSWSSWAYGWSFSCRALLETLMILSIPLAAFIQRISQLKISPRLGIGAGLLLLLSLNLFQSYQYCCNILPGEKVTEAYYWRVFLKKEASHEDRKLLSE